MVSLAWAVRAVPCVVAVTVSRAVVGEVLVVVAAAPVVARPAMESWAVVARVAPDGGADAAEWSHGT